MFVSLYINIDRFVKGLGNHRLPAWPSDGVDFKSDVVKSR